MERVEWCTYNFEEIYSIEEQASRAARVRPPGKWRRERRPREQPHAVTGVGDGDCFGLLKGFSVGEARVLSG